MIAISQVTAAVLLYSARVHRGFDAGDVVVFGVPLLIATLCYYVVLAFKRPPGDRLQLAGLSAAFSVVSFVVALVINLNAYGS